MKFSWFQKLRRRQREEKLDAEIRSHLDEARANALREFGKVGLSVNWDECVRRKLQAERQEFYDRASAMGCP